MKSAFPFRLYPNREQERKLLVMVEAGRRLWNDALSHRRERWEEQRLSTSYSSSAGYSPLRGEPTRCWGGAVCAGRTGNP